MSEGAFEGVRVVELAQWVFVPVAGALLADWGADVVHIERLEGDPYRGLATQGIGSESGGVNLSLALANRGKRSMALNVQAEAGQAVLDRLLESADVFLTNLRPKALTRLGLDAETLTERFPALVYASGNGYGTRGPDADHAGYDSSGVLGPGWRCAHADTGRPRPSDRPTRGHGRPKRSHGAGIRDFGGVAQAHPYRPWLGCRCLTVGHRHVDDVVRPVGRSRGGLADGRQRTGSDS